MIYEKLHTVILAVRQQCQYDSTDHGEQHPRPVRQDFLKEKGDKQCDEGNCQDILVSLGQSRNQLRPYVHEVMPLLELDSC